MKLLLSVVVLTVTATVTVHCRVLQVPREQLITGGLLQGFDVKNKDDGQGYTGTLNDDDFQGYTGTLNDDDYQGYTGTLNIDDYQGYTGTLDDDDDQGYTGTVNDDDYQGYTGTLNDDDDDDDDQGYTGTLNDDGDQGYTGTLAFERKDPPEVTESDLFEGDILLSEEQWTALRSRKATADLARQWTEGPDGYPLVPYRILDSVRNRGVVRAGLDHWMEHTCIKFEPAANNINQPHLKFTSIGWWENECYSRIGMMPWNHGQDITLACGYNIGTVIHEVGHAIGWYHEHSRSDRDKYVITHGNDNNYNKAEDNNYTVPYDYTSIMHYSRWSSLEVLDPRAEYLIGQSKGLSHRDKLLANRMYNCTGKWLSKCKLSSDPCLNDGYMKYDESTGQCACVCPPGTRKSNCEESFADYYGFTSCNPSCYNGKCEEGKCQCNTGYTGTSCSEKVTTTTTTPSPTTTKTSTVSSSSTITTGSDCIDKNESCQSWADIGECKKNPDYMLTYCAKACNQCVGSDCIDKNKSCQSWADIGECKKNPDYMLTYCAKACNQCVGSDCIDKNESCQSWAHIGECKKNPDYMLTYCPKACNQCVGVPHV